MGPDMYLYEQRRTCRGKFGQNPGSRQLVKDFLQETFDIDADNDLDTIHDITVTCEVGYWRKANQIHVWFVDNVQNGVDDCARYEVSIQQLCDDLRIRCERVLDNMKLAPQLLPWPPGFFYGGQEYDANYVQDLEHTMNILTNIQLDVTSDRLCGHSTERKFYYEASW